MFSEGALRIEVHRGGKVSVLDVQSDRARVGSGAHCDVRLAPDEGAIEQLAVEARDEEVHVRVLALQHPCLLNGAPFIEGRIPETATLELGGVLLRMKFVPGAVKPEKRGGKASTPPALQALALVGLAVGFYFVLGNKGLDGSPLGTGMAEPPKLALGEEACSQSERPAAYALAEESLLAAEARRERAPFYARDGLSAVRLFLRAASCYERAGDGRAAGDARAAASELHARLSDELHVRHVRLERLLAEQRYADAKRESQIISEYVADPSAPYSQWLSAVVREGELQAKRGAKP
ncbi:MAG: hypothetical protein ABW252_17760 [Polyangiales bacterium]